jgi:TetR/AcrR family transcriptional regulator, transcriptional repressor of aconitase
VSVPRVSGEHRSQERRRLVDGAWEAFQKSGNNVSTQEILDACGLSEEVFHQYFESVDEILNAVGQERIGETLALVAAGGDPGEGDRSLLVRYLVEILRRPVKTPELVYYRSRALEDDTLQEPILQMNRSVVEKFAPFVNAAQEAGELEPGWDPEAVTELVDILVDGINRRHLSDTFATSFQRVGDTAIALLLGGLLVPEQQRRG